MDTAGFGDGALVRFADSIWTATTPVRFVGTWFPHVMMIVRLGSGELLIHSPCRPSDALMRDISALVEVAHVVAPNWFHDLYLDRYRALYPRATLWAPAFLQRRSSIVVRCLDDSTRPPWFDEMPHVALSGLLSFDECVFFHKATRTLIVADLLMNAAVSARTPLLTKLGYTVFGLNGEVKVFPILRWFGFSSRTSLRHAAERICSWNPDRLIVGHGIPTDVNVPAALRDASRWLRA